MRSGPGIFSFLTQRIRDIKETVGTDFRLWKQNYLSVEDHFSSTAELAAAGGLFASCPAFMFASGYQSALRSIFGTDTLRGEIASFGITEAGGGSPSAINSSLIREGNQLIVTGEKTFLTLGIESGIYFTAAAEGRGPEGRKNIKIVKLLKDSPGITLTHFELPFVKEVSHARMTMNRTPVTMEQIIEGDGYSDYIKPFRTVEDIHLFSALSGYIMRCSLIHKWPGEIFEEALSLHAALVRLNESPPSSPGAVIAASGAKRTLDSLLNKTDSHWHSTGGQEALLWHRDRALFSVAANVREKRVAKAWEESGLLEF